MPLKISTVTQESLVAYCKATARTKSFQGSLRTAQERIDGEYFRTSNMRAEHLAAKRAAEAGDKKQLPDITVPVIYPQVESAHAYLTGVFLSGFPIFSAVASPSTQKYADMLDTIIAHQSISAGWVRNLSIALRDGLKYNILACEICWERKNTYSLQLNEKEVKFSPKQSYWEGNSLKRLDPYNIFFDNRVPIAQVHVDGEFAGYHEIISRVKLKRLIGDLPEENVMNIREALSASQGEEFYYVPNVTDKLTLDPRKLEFDWLSWAHPEVKNSPRISYNNYYQKTVLYARIVPEDFGLDVPAKATPQIWKFIYINTSVLLYAERLTNAHDFLPIVFGSPIEDGLSYQTLSFAENLIEVQNMASALWNNRMAAARRSVGDRVIYDPQKIAPADINSSSPTAKIPIRPNSYNNDIRTAVFPLPYNDSASASLIRDALQVVDFGRSISGINKPQEGQFIKGNRTLEEFNEVMINSIARLQTMALLLEAQFFTPLKEIIKTNILQYLKPQDIYSHEQRAKVKINPIELADAAVEFTISDGLLPASKIANSDFLRVLLQTISSSPVLSQQFDVAGVISYISSLQNIAGLDNFKLTKPATNLTPVSPPA